MDDRATTARDSRAGQGRDGGFGGKGPSAGQRDDGRFGASRAGSPRPDARGGRDSRAQRDTIRRSGDQPSGAPSDVSEPGSGRQRGTIGPHAGGSAGFGADSPGRPGRLSGGAGAPRRGFRGEERGSGGERGGAGYGSRGHGTTRPGAAGRGGPRTGDRPAPRGAPRRPGGGGWESQGRPQHPGAGREDRLRPPESATADQLDPEARAELRTLPGDLAGSVARWLVAAVEELDPGTAYEYAIQARQLAARVGVVRETCGITAYRAGKWAEALAEFRAARRLTGRNIYLPMMADAERGLGRPDRALAIIQDPGARLDRQTQIELLIVESGIRRDEGRPAAGVVVLQVPELTDGRLRPWSARLFYAYADALLDADRAEEAREWFGRAMAADAAGETDAGERFEDLDSVIIEDLWEDEDDDEADGSGGPDGADAEPGDPAPEPGDPSAGPPAAT